MGLINLIKSQFIEVIEWTDSSHDTLVYRFPVNNKEIKMGAKLTVRESQAAVFINEGQLADVFAPGLYELMTDNLPILTKLKSWKFGFNSPFKAEVYFVNTKQFTDQKWGTTNPVMMRDAEFGPIRIRAFGTFSYKVSDPATFLKEVFGTSASFDTSEILGQLKNPIVSSFSDALAELKIPALDIATQYDELGDKVKEKMQPKFQALGLELSTFCVVNVSLPEEVEKVMDTRTSMGIIGNMSQYTQYEAAEAMRDAAKNPGNGMVNGGIGIGTGFALGNMMYQNVNPNIQPQAYQQNQPQTQQQNGQSRSASSDNQNNAPLANCSKCNTPVPSGFKFCPECGTPVSSDKFCSQCGFKIETGMKFCPKCGTKIE